MKGYTSKYDKAKEYVNRNYPISQYTDQQRNNILKQIFSKFIVGFATIGKNNNGQLVIHKDNPHQGINYGSNTQ